MVLVNDPMTEITIQKDRLLYVTQLSKF